MPITPHRRNGSLGAKIARRWVRLEARRPLAVAPPAPMVSFSFDDPPLSATLAGARVLESAGLRGAFYVASGLLGTSGHFGAYAGWEDIARLAAAGHEIACHTHDHRDLAGCTAAEIEAQVLRNATAFAEHDLPASLTFAYPYGEVTRLAKATLGSRFGLLRAIHKGVLTAGVDLNQAPAVLLEGPHAEAVAAKWLDLAVRQVAWVIFYSHDVTDAPTPWGCAPAVLAAVVRRVRASGAEVVTVSEGLLRLGALPASPTRPAHQSGPK